MTLERATVEDLDALLALEASFEPPWSAQSWRTELEGAGRYVPIVRRDGELVGVACFQLVGDVADLHRIVVAPERRRSGIARVLMVAGLRWALAQGATSMMLEVDSNNAAAIALYRGYGFAPVARRRDYYGAGVDALVMECSLEGEDDDSVAMWDVEAKR